MHKTSFYLNAWTLPMVAWLGACSLLTTLSAQTTPSLTIESVLRGVQERKLMLQVKTAVGNELYKESINRTSGNPNVPVTPGDLPSIDTTTLISWPNIPDKFPADGVIQDIRVALVALNLAVAEYYDFIEPAYLTIPADQTELQNDGALVPMKNNLYMEIGLPPIAKFTEDNWRENLWVFASNINQMKALTWPVMTNRTKGWNDWSSKKKIEDPPHSNTYRTIEDSLDSYSIKTPAEISADGGTTVSSCSKGYIYTTASNSSVFQWVTNSYANSPAEPTKPSGSCRSTVDFVSGIKTKTVSMQWSSAEPQSTLLAGAMDFFLGAGAPPDPGTYAAVWGPNSLNDGLRKDLRKGDNLWALNTSRKIPNPYPAGSSEVVLGDLSSQNYPDADESSALSAEYEAMRAWLQMPVISINQCTWEQVTPSTKRLKMIPFSMSLDKCQAGYATSNALETAAVHLWCIHRPQFTPMPLGIVKNMDGASMHAGHVSLLPRKGEPVRVHLGRGVNDRQQSAWLSTTLDGFGSLDFKGSFSAFEVLYETNSDNYESPVPLTSSGDPKDIYVLPADEFTSAQKSAIGFPFTTGSGASLSRLEYMRKWYHSRLRQVKGGDVLVDITYPTGFKKVLNFYWASEVAAKTGKFYSLPLLAFKTVVIENPHHSGNSLPTQYNTLKVVENGSVQHLIQGDIVDNNTSNWTFDTTNIGTGSAYKKFRTLAVTYSSPTLTTSWDDTVTENDVITWHSLQKYKEKFEPVKTDFPLLTSSITTQDSDTRKVTIEWNYNSITDPHYTKFSLYTNPVSLTANEGTSALNETVTTFAPDCYYLVGSETRKILSKDHMATRVWNGNTKTTTSKLGGIPYATNTLAYSNDFQRLTSTTGTLVTNYTYGAPDSTMPWVLIKMQGPDGWQEDFSHTFAADSTSSTMLSGWGTNHLGGHSVSNIVNRFGCLLSRVVSTTDGVLLESTSGTNPTIWGAPQLLTYLDGRQESVSFNTSSPATYGTLASATNVFGQQMTVTGYDGLKRPTSINTGFDTVTPSYTNPLEAKVTFGAGYAQKVQVNGFGDFRVSSTTEGSGAAVDLTPGAASMTIGERSVPLSVTTAGEVKGANSGLGSRGTKTELDVDADNRLRVTTTQLTQANADHHSVKMSYDANGRLRKRVSKGPNDGDMTETWDYPDARTVIYTPGPGPVLKPVTRTLSTDGLRVTTKLGDREVSRETRSVQNGRLALVSEIYDDSGEGGDVWRTVSTQTLAPASGAMSFTPWDLAAEASTQTASGSATRTISSTAGTDTTTTTLTQGLTTAVSGTVDGIEFEFDTITYDHGRLTGASGTLAGKDVGFSLDDDGRISNLRGAGFDKTYTYGGAPGYQVTVVDSVKGTTQVVSASAVGDFTSLSGNGVQPVSASTTDQAGGKTTTNYSNFGLDVQNAADGSLLSKDYAGGMLENRSYDAEGLTASMGTGPEALTVSHPTPLSRSTTRSGYAVSETFYNVGLRESVSGFNDERSFKYQRMALASEEHTAGPWEGTTVSYGQDERGRLGSMNVGNQFGVTYHYVGGTSRFGSLSANGISASYGWDPNTGKRATMQRGTVGTSWESTEDDGRETSVTTGGLTFGYGYDHGNPGIPLKSRSVSGGVGWTSLQYANTGSDKSGRLTSVTLSNGTTLNYDYDARGNRMAGGNAATTYRVNDLNQIESRDTATTALGYGVYGTLKPAAPATLPLPAGAKVRVTHPLAPEGEELPVNLQTGAYQGWWQMGSNQSGVTAVKIVVEGFLPGKGSLINGGPQRKNAVTEETAWVVIPAASESFTYDAAGRLSEDGTWTYVWDAAGHLTELTRKAGTSTDPSLSSETISYSYDSDGRRTGRTHTIHKTGSSVAQTETSKVLWDGWLPVCEERTVNGTDLPRRWFVWGPDVSGTLGGAGGIGGLVYIREEGGRTLVPVDDGLGNIIAVIAQDGPQAGTIIARYDYGPYGEGLGSSGEVDACPFRFQSKWWDAEAGLNYFGYRHYSPRVGRWLSRDPMGEAGGMNLYAYCEGDPVNKYDYLGMDAKELNAAIETAKKDIAALALVIAQLGGASQSGGTLTQDELMAKYETLSSAHQDSLTDAYRWQSAYLSEMDAWDSLWQSNWDIAFEASKLPALTLPTDTQSAAQLLSLGLSGAWGDVAAGGGEAGAAAAGDIEAGANAASLALGVGSVVTQGTRIAVTQGGKALLKFGGQTAVGIGVGYGVNQGIGWTGEQLGLSPGQISAFQNGLSVVAGLKTIKGLRAKRAPTPAALYTYVPKKMVRVINGKPLLVDIQRIAGQGLKPGVGGKVWAIDMPPSQFSSFRIGGQRGADLTIGRFPSILRPFKKNFADGYVVEITDTSTFSPASSFWKRWLGQYTSSVPVSIESLKIQLLKAATD